MRAGTCTRQGSFDPALPGRSMMASRFRDPLPPWSAKTVRAWKPQVFFHVGVSLTSAPAAYDI